MQASFVLHCKIFCNSCELKLQTTIYRLAYVDKIRSKRKVKVKDDDEEGQF